MTTLDPLVEIPKLTDKDRIVYRYAGAPESQETGLYVDKAGALRTMTGDTVLAASVIGWGWVGDDPMFILEAVIPPAFIPYRGMLLEDVSTKELWVYEPSQLHLEWTSTDIDVRDEASIAARFAAGELTIFTPEVPA